MIEEVAADRDRYMATVSRVWCLLWTDHRLEDDETITAAQLRAALKGTQ